GGHGRRAIAGAAPQGCAGASACRNLAPVTDRQPFPPTTKPHRAFLAAAFALLLLAGCGRDDAAGGETAVPSAAEPASGDGSVTISGDDRLAGRLTWRAPAVELGDDEEALADALARAADALASGDLAA